MTAAGMTRGPVRETAMKKRSEDFRERDGWLCPASVAHTGTRMLYQAVAYWALLQGRGVTVRDVSEAFAIPVRRASDVLHYIVHEAPASIEASVSLIRGAGNGQQKVVRVSRIFPQHFPQAEKVAKKISGLSQVRPRRARPDGEVQRLRTWFISRRPGETAPPVLSSGATEKTEHSGNNNVADMNIPPKRQKVRKSINEREIKNCSGSIYGSGSDLHEHHGRR
ncbi:CaiF/GrlA family transcriptional regulator [Salmonella enterica subsp. enterica serovar Muenchen]|nr:CaiF/GrlA family transcriptional regulator [Salmonella enterica subsp. enterica serovar Muenchen]ECZ5457900.1 CaiF/GrlA family transcriptional regulator [Salmonella enterica subsp. enterica serovar Muenchen]EDG8466762.1 CaiF/GrlA family transcriptional regulator [Salmonella enterica subsp. enterica serovar Muenchen]EDQ9741374.1 CaiF/GrlA family transcriptional regulator [Salmonella enterica subsp. enterica serovar Oranienburg]